MFTRSLCAHHRFHPSSAYLTTAIFAMDEMDGCTTLACTLARLVGNTADDYKAKMQTLDSFIHTFEFEPKISKLGSASFSN